MCARKPLTEDKCREGETFALEELVDIRRSKIMGEIDARRTEAIWALARAIA
jgi:hypothetical protein